MLAPSYRDALQRRSPDLGVFPIGTDDSGNLFAALSLQVTPHRSSDQS